MSLNITVSGVSYPNPSGAADTNWAARQVAFLQALAATVSKGPAVQRLTTVIVPVGNAADNTEDTLQSYSLLASTLSAGQGLRVTAWGAGVNTADATTLRAYFGTQLILSRVLTPAQVNTWRAQVELLAIDSGNVTCTAQLTQGGAATALVVASLSSFAAVLANAQLIRFTGQRGGAAVANSVVQYGMAVELIP